MTIRRLALPLPSIPSDMVYACENVKLCTVSRGTVYKRRTLNLATGHGLYSLQGYIHLDIYRNEHTGRMI